jgi:hypothetical protein
LDYWQARQGIWRDELNDWRELQRYRDTFLVNMFIPSTGTNPPCSPTPYMVDLRRPSATDGRRFFSLAGGWHT